MNANDLSQRSPLQVSIHSLSRAALFAIALTFGCAGKTNESQAGLSACGSSCSVNQITESCSSTCAKMIQTNCYKDQDSAKCTRECVAFGDPAKCPKAVEFLRCAESVMPTCVRGEPDFGPTCTAIFEEADKCGGGVDSVPVPGPVGTGAGGAGPVVVDPHPEICPNIPRRTVGGGACAGSGRAPDGTDAALDCTSTCQDGSGNLWEATCNGTTCSCSYNRTQMCTCTMTANDGLCASCCPGTQQQ